MKILFKYVLGTSGMRVCSTGGITIEWGKLCPRPQIIFDDILSFGLVEVKAPFVNFNGFI